MKGSQEKPNIIYILGDDQRAEYLGCMGHPIIETPNIDALAKKGALFTEAFCTSPLCTPSRCCHYLGQWERKHGVNFNSCSAVSEEAWENSFPMLLKKAGYFTGWVGKNHVPLGRGGYDGGYMEKTFDYWYGNHHHTGFYPKEGPGKEIYSNSRRHTQVEVFEEGAMNFLDPRREFIESCRRPIPYRPKDKPFCLCVTFNLPHDRSTGYMQMRPGDDELYKSGYRDRINDFPLPKTYRAFGNITEPKIPAYVYNGIYLDCYDYVKRPAYLRERMVRICQTITGVDRFVGNLCRKLKELEIEDNTIIVFSTDHGIHHGEHGLGGKALLYEEDLRIPLVIYDPRVPAGGKGQVRKELALVPDLAPTVLALAGIPAPDAMQGTSLAPLLYGMEVEWRGDFFAEALFDDQNYPRSESVRSGEWKYIRYFRRAEDSRQKGWYRGTLDGYETSLDSSIYHGEVPIYEELYHLAEDPYEEKNLAFLPEASEKLGEMRKRILVLGRQLKGPQERPSTVSLQKQSPA